MKKQTIRMYTKKLLACTLTAAMVVSGAAAVPAQAAKKPALNKTSLSLKQGASYQLKLKNIQKGKKAKKLQRSPGKVQKRLSHRFPPKEKSRHAGPALQRSLLPVMVRNTSVVSK